MIEFKNVYREDGSPDPSAVSLLYSLLAERPDYANISHARMPSYSEHWAFVAGEPYRVWWIISAGGSDVGAIYATRANEIGIAVKREFQRAGIARLAILELMRKLEPVSPDRSLVPARFVAHVAPENTPSIYLFEGLGGRKIQVTYELPQPEEKTT